MIILPSRVKLPGLKVLAAQVSVSLVMIGVDQPGLDRGLGVVHNPCFRIHLDKSGKDLELTPDVRHEHVHRAESEGRMLRIVIVPHYLSVSDGRHGHE